MVVLRAGASSLCWHLVNVCRIRMFSSSLYDITSLRLGPICVHVLVQWTPAVCVVRVGFPTFFEGLMITP